MRTSAGKVDTWPRTVSKRLPHKQPASNTTSVSREIDGPERVRIRTEAEVQRSRLAMQSQETEII